MVAVAGGELNLGWRLVAVAGGEFDWWRGWSRSPADELDLWRLVAVAGGELDLVGVVAVAGGELDLVEVRLTVNR